MRHSRISQAPGLAIWVLWLLSFSHFCLNLTRSHGPRTAKYQLAVAAEGFRSRGQRSMGLCGIEFNKRWRDMVERGLVQTKIVGEDGEAITYGLRIDPEDTRHAKIVQFAEKDQNKESILPEGLSKYAGQYLVQIAGIRRLRPPAVRNLSSLPPHDPNTCSLCGGPYRLQLREPLGTIIVPGTDREWDCHYNIAPQQVYGHALLVPTLQNEANRRAQHLTREDCIDLIILGYGAKCDSETRSGLCINYNHPGAGASQNHIHAHAWVQNNPYPIDKAKITDKAPFMLREGHVQARVVQDYPAAAVFFTGEDPSQVGNAVYDVIKVATGEYGFTYNLLTSALAGRGYKGVGVYLFIRGTDATNEAPLVLGQRIGSGQMAGEWIIDKPDVFAQATEEKINKALYHTRPSSLKLSGMEANEEKKKDERNKEDEEEEEEEEKDEEEEDRPHRQHSPEAASAPPVFLEELLAKARGSTRW